MCDGAFSSLGTKAFDSLWILLFKEKKWMLFKAFLDLMILQWIHETTLQMEY